MDVLVLYTITTGLSLAWKYITRVLIYSTISRIHNKVSLSSTVTKIGC